MGNDVWEAFIKWPIGPNEEAPINPAHQSKIAFKKGLILMYMSCTVHNMSQININVTPEFARDLSRYMKRKGIRQKTEAIRKAVCEAAEKVNASGKEGEFRNLLGIGLKAPLNPYPRFKTEDELWEKG